MPPYGPTRSNRVSYAETRSGQTSSPMANNANRRQALPEKTPELWELNSLRLVNLGSLCDPAGVHTYTTETTRREPNDFGPRARSYRVLHALQERNRNPRSRTAPFACSGHQ